MRTFVALPVYNNQARRFLSQCCHALQAGQPDVKWVAENHYHLTLRFLGDIEPRLVDEVRGAVDQVARKAPSLETILELPGAFPGLNRPQTLWMGVRDSGRQIAILEKELSDRLAELGFVPDRKPFHPHITLGRMRSPRGADSLRKALETWSLKDVCPCRFDQLVLFESQLTPAGPVYSALLEAPLGQSQG